MDYLKQKKQKFIALLLILVMIFSLSGCVNRREINKLGLLGAIALDIENDKVQVTMEVNKPAGKDEEGKGKPAVIIQSTGDTFFEAMRNATMKFDRKIFVTTSRVLIISEEAASRGIADFLDFWVRDHEPRSSSYLLIAKGCDASEIIGITGGINDMPSLYIEDLISANRANSKSMDKNLFQFLKEYYAEGIQPTLGIIQKKEKEKSTKPGEQEFELFLEGSAVFKEDRIVGTLDGLEARAVRFITGKAASGIIVSEVGPNSIEIMSSDSKMDVEIQNGRYLLKVEITIDGMLGGQSGSIDLKDPQAMKQVEAACSQVVKEQIEEVLTKAQEDFGLDIFGFGQVFHRKHPEEWKTIKDDWDDLFAASEFTVQVKTNISRSGLLNLPINMKSGK